ncbi:MAG TPA: hypothetical protein PKY05_14590, partial [Fibrobacteria bacterium]|nr:hypothetical protein [Fibrobacteria bacterium]
GHVVPRRSCGKLTHQGARYLLAIRPAQKTPVIQSAETGKMWTITWERLLELAIDEGIAEPFAESLDHEDEPA